MFVFLDLEASSLTNGYPTEVGWVRYGDAAQYSALIRPQLDWIKYRNWDSSAEAVTGITREYLMSDGRPRSEVSADLLRDLSGHHVFVSGGLHDTEWLHMITEPTIIPLEDFDGLLAAAALRAGWVGVGGAESLEVVTNSARAKVGLREHRALEDARAMLIAFEVAMAGPPRESKL